MNVSADPARSRPECTASESTPRLPASNPTRIFKAVMTQAANTDTSAAQRFSALACAVLEMAVLDIPFFSLPPPARSVGISQAGFTPRHSPAIPKLYGVHDTSTNPAARIMSSITPGLGKFPTDSGKYA